MTTEPRPAAPSGRHPLLMAFLMLAAGAAGLVAGVRWHSTLEAMAPALGRASAPPASAGEPRELWTCSMHPQVIQDHPGVCPICHMQLTPLDVESPGGEPGASTTPPSAERKIKYWWDPMMSPPYLADKPGKSPMGMDLVPVYEDQAAAPAPGAVTIDPAMVQNMGIRTATVTEGPLARSVRAVGYLQEAQPLTRDINLRVSGWVRRLYAATEGQHVQAGDPLFDLYSPEIQLAVEELIAARRACAAAPVSTGPDAGSAAEFYDAATRKLQLFGLDQAQVLALAGLEDAPESVTFTSPITGDISEKPVVEGGAVRAGDLVLRIADHATLWLDARVFEKDLPLVRLGDVAAVTIPSGAGSALAGEVVFIHPRLDPATRTALVRVSVPNADLTLRPAMYATVRLRAKDPARAVLVPREAIIDTGESQIAFVVLGQGRFEPREVAAGLTSDGGMVQVIAGLSPGEEVVTSGQFLLDSESRLREAVQAFLGQRQARDAGPRAPGPEGPGQPAERPPASPGADVASEPLQAALDRVVSAYLDLSAALGAEQTSSEPIDTTAFSAAVTACRQAAAGAPHEPVVAALESAAGSMGGRSIDAQREAFKAVSQRAIALVETLPPSPGVAERLYLMDCPMAPGNWLQRTPEIANPFYSSGMKRCGSILRTITPATEVAR